MRGRTPRPRRSLAAVRPPPLALAATTSSAAVAGGAARASRTQFSTLLPRLVLARACVAVGDDVSVRVRRHHQQPSPDASRPQDGRIWGRARRGICEGLCKGIRTFASGASVGHNPRAVTRAFLASRVGAFSPRTAKTLLHLPAFKGAIGYHLSSLAPHPLAGRRFQRRCLPFFSGSRGSEGATPSTSATAAAAAAAMAAAAVAGLGDAGDAGGAACGPSRDRLRIAVIGDVHSCWDTRRDVAALKYLQPDIVLFVGDFAEEDVELVAEVASVQQHMGDGVRVAVILGNHDAWYSMHGPGGRRGDVGHHDMDALDKQLELLGECHVGFGRLDLCDLELSVVGGRPFSYGPSSFPKAFYVNRCSVAGVEESAAKIVAAARGAPSHHSLVVLAHNGPSGLGSEPADICGRDFPSRARGNKIVGGDFGDPDLEGAIHTLATDGRHIPLVVFGHMHELLWGGQGLRRMTVVGPPLDSWACHAPSPTQLSSTSPAIDTGAAAAAAAAGTAAAAEARGVATETSQETVPSSQAKTVLEGSTISRQPGLGSLEELNLTPRTGDPAAEACQPNIATPTSFPAQARTVGRRVYVNAAVVPRVRTGSNARQTAEGAATTASHISSSNSGTAAAGAAGVAPVADTEHHFVVIEMGRFPTVETRGERREVRGEPWHVLAVDDVWVGVRAGWPHPVPASGRLLGVADVSASPESAVREGCSTAEKAEGCADTPRDAHSLRERGREEGVAGDLVAEERLREKRLEGSMVQPQLVGRV